MTRTDLDSWEDKQATKRRRQPPPQQDGLHSKLEAAKTALALAEQIPAITELIDHAEAIRAAARAKHVSAEGINSWTMFIIDAERKAWAHIKAMQDAGELPKHGGNRKSNPKARGLVLDDLVPSQRVSEWTLLAKLSEDQLDEMERIANEEDRLLTRGELLSLGKASASSSSKSERPRSAKTVEVIEQAREIAAGITEAKIKIADDAKVNTDECGWWVETWLWVENPLSRSDLEFGD